jgi:ABC-2 type transport system permease protein
VKVLLQKELLELFRTRRVLFLPLLFIALGISGPVLIRMLPLIVERSGPGLGMSLPEMGPADGFQQFLELSRQFGLLAVILVFMGLVAGERRDGVLVTLFVKPVSRLSYLAARWAANALYALLSMVLGVGVALLYTLLLLGTPDLRAALLAAVLYASYLLLAVSWTFFFSSLTRSPAAAAGLALLPLFLLPLLGFLWAPLGRYGPYGAVSAGTAVVGGVGQAVQGVPPAAWASAGINIAASIALVGAAYLALREAEL